MNMTDTSISIHELLDELGGRLSYRQIDYWVRMGVITLRYPGHGSGTRRRVMPDERAAIAKLVEEYERIEAAELHLRSGELFLELLGWHDIDVVPHEDAS